MIEKYLNRVICGDALEVLRALPNDSVDAVITDPPYCSGGRSINAKQQGTGRKYEKNQYERPDFVGDAKDSRGWLAWCGLWISECYRILKAGGLLYLFLRLETAANGNGCNTDRRHIMARNSGMEQGAREPGTTQGVFPPPMRVFGLGYKRTMRHAGEGAVSRMLRVPCKAIR